MIAAQLSRSSRSATTVQSVTRAFTTTAIRPKTPSLADVTNNGVDSFNAKQKEFRADLAAKQKPKFEPSQSGAGRFDAVNSSTPSSSFQSFTFLSEAPTAPHASTAGPVSNTLGLGKLSIAAEPVGPEGEKPTGKLSSLIYGTKEGREMDQQIEQSFSQVLARGKYVHSIVFHEVKPDKVDEYVELVGNWYPKMASMPENKVHLVGSWRTEVGDSDTFGMFPITIYFSISNNLQSTSGSTRNTTATTPPSTQSPTTPTSPPLTRSSRPSSPPNASP
jgi:hypothetical protein